MDYKSQNQNVRSLQEALLEIISTQHPKKALESLSRFILEVTKSSGMAIYYATIVNGRESLVVLHDTESDPNQFCYRPLLDGRGITEWVLTNGEWVIGKGLLPSDDNAGSFLTQGGKVIHIVSTRREAWNPPLGKNREWATCFIPMKIGADKHNAVITFWQDNHVEYGQKELQSGSAFLPAITICCQHVLSLTQMEKAQRTQFNLTEHINLSIAPFRLKQQFLTELNHYYSARCVVALNKVRYPLEPKSVCYATEWMGHKNDPLQAVFERFCIEFPYGECDSGRIKGYLKEALQPILAEHKAQLRLMEFMPEDRTFLLVIDDQRKLMNIAQCFPWQMTSFDRSGLEHIWPLYRVFKKAHLRESIEVIGSQSDINELEADYTTPVLEALLRITKADVVMVYLGVADSMNVKNIKFRAGLEQDERLTSHSIGKPYDLKDTLTKLSLDANKTLLLPNITDKSLPFVNQVNLARLKHVFGEGFEGKLLSWLCCPIAKGEEKFGVIKLLTFDTGNMLTGDSISICEGFADYLYTKHKRYISEQALLQLNQITNDLITISGEDLELSLVLEMEDWAAEYICTDCKVAIFSFVETGELFSCMSDGIEAMLSTSREEKIARLEPHSGERFRSAIVGGYHYVSIPIRVSEVSKLSGVIVFLSKEPFTNEAKEQAVKAGNNISLIIYQEYLRHQSVRELAKFRHAIVAPIQGLTGRAKQTIRLAERNQLIPRIGEMAEAIYRESNIIRNWLNISRMLGKNKEPAINKEKFDIAGIVDDCIYRYCKTAEKRRIEIIKEWNYKRECMMNADRIAIDIALSNLIDNAVKYSYSDTVLRVIFNIRGNNAILTVINYGRKLSEEFKTRQTTPLKFTWKEQSANVAGQGVGLDIVTSLLNAHDGELRFQDMPATQKRADGKEVYQVTFQMVIPLGLKRERV